MSFRFPTAVAALALSLAAPAFAALPTGQLSFVQRTGTVAADERIPVVLRLTLDAGSAPLSFSSDPLTGFAAADLPSDGNFYNDATKAWETRGFASVTGAYLNTRFSCQGSFTAVCDPSANYRFEFNTAGTAEHPSLNFRTSFMLNAGESFDYTFGFFVPQAGGAAPGTYSWNGSSLFLTFVGVDADGNTGYREAGMDINTGFSLDESAAFQRTVSAIPEPGSWALMALGMAGLGAVARRRKA